MKYKMQLSCGTTGRVTGKRYTWEPGQIIEAPAGEFDHLARHHYQALGGGAEKATAEPVAETATLAPSVDATDSARKLAAARGIDLASITGSGAGGRITKGDVEAQLD